MADGVFPSLVSKSRDVNAVANPIWVELTDGTTAIGVTGGALDVNIASGALTVDFSYAEDVAHTTGDTGAFVLAVRNDTLGALAGLSGDYAPFQVDANGALYVEAGLVSIDDNGGSITVDGTVAATQSGTWNIGTVTTITNAVTIVDGGGAITVDGTVTVTATQLDVDDLNLTDDAVRISGNSTANGELNPIFVQNVNTVVSGEEVHAYGTAVAVAADTASNHDYTVAGTTFLLKSVIIAASGAMKAEVQVGPVATLATVAVAFLNNRQGDTKQLFFDPPIEVPVTSTGTVRVIRTNREGSAQDVYSTIVGYDV